MKNKELNNISNKVNNINKQMNDFAKDMNLMKKKYKIEKISNLYRIWCYFRIELFRFNGCIS